MSRRTLSIVLMPLLLAVASPSPAPAGDHVFLLAGRWTCRTFIGSIVQRLGRRDGNLLDVAGDVQAASGTFTFDDRFTFDRAAGVWHVRFGAGSPAATDGTAPPWTESTWDVVVHGAQGSDERVRYELLPDGNLRRSAAQPVPGIPGVWRPISAELCTQGDTPPAADACIAENFPAFTISVGKPPSPAVPPGTPAGNVLVVVSLDAQSQIVDARIQSSPSKYFDDYALQTVRQSRFQTEVRDCHPIAADYIFTVGMRP